MGIKRTRIFWLFKTAYFIESMRVDISPSAVHICRLFLYYRYVSTGSNIIRRIMLTCYLCILVLELAYRKYKDQTIAKKRPEVNWKPAIKSHKSDHVWKEKSAHQVMCNEFRIMVTRKLDFGKLTCSVGPECI